MDENLPTTNNNPGDLRFAGQQGATQGKGGFAAFANPQAGFNALENQVQSRITQNPNETLEDFVGNPTTGYAPKSDGNNPGEYTAKLATALGVSPLAPLSSLSSKVGQFSAAIATNEGYEANSQDTQSSQSSGGSNALTTGLGIGAGLLGAGIKADAPFMPTELAAGGAALGGLAGLAPVGAIVGDVAGQGLQGLVNDSSGKSQSQTPTSAADTSTTPTETPLPTFPGESQAEPETDLKPVASAFNNVLSTTVGGQKTTQEGTNRGITDIGQEAAQMGYIPQVDANGNYDKISPQLLINAENAQDAESLNNMAGSMKSEISLDDARQAALEEARSKMQNSPDLDSTLAHIQKTFEGHSRQHPLQVDKNGRPLSMTQQFINPLTLRQMEVRASEGENWASAPHERSASQHIKTALGKHLSKIAKNEGVKGWDETKRRMETRFLIKTAIKALPKKAQRDFKKELLHEIAGSLAGAAVGKTLGHGLIGGVVGGLIERRLGHKQYRQLGNKAQRKELEKRQKAPIKGLLHRSK